MKFNPRLGLFAVMKTAPPILKIAVMANVVLGILGFLFWVILYHILAIIFKWAKTKLDEYLAYVNSPEYKAKMAFREEETAFHDLKLAKQDRDFAMERGKDVEFHIGQVDRKIADAKYAKEKADKAEDNLKR